MRCTHTRSHRKIDFLQNSAASLAFENIFSKNNIRPGHVSVRFLWGASYVHMQNVLGSAATHISYLDNFGRFLFMIKWALFPIFNEMFDIFRRGDKEVVYN